MDDALPEVAGYRFEAKLAEGGMGVVYRAVDDTLGRTVAIKMIRGALLGKGDEEEETVARFLREARAAAQIRSNHVAHVLQFGRTAAGDLFLVLEYLDGITLADVLRKEKRVSPERAVHITRQICRGMEAAHQLGIVHRDLKPSNVMLVDQDGDREFVKILDFGVAKVVGERESGVTRAGMLVGTYTCMAPEQVVNETIDARTDVYALAVMLFRLLTGKPLFDGTDVTAVLYHHVHTPAPTPSRIAPDAGIPPTLDAIVLRCLEKKPSRRVRSMADLERALGLSLALDANPDDILAPAPTMSGLAEEETRVSGERRREPTAEGDDDEVFAESGPLRSVVDSQAETRITESGSLPAALTDPPTPGTSTSSREPVSLGARSGAPLVSLVSDAGPRSRAKPLVAAAVVTALVLLVALAGVALSIGGKEDVVVVVQPAEVTSSPPPPPEPAPAPAATKTSDAGAADPVSEEAASVVEESEQQESASTPRAESAPPTARSQPRSSSKERTSETRRRRPSRKKSDDDKRAAPKPDDVIPDDKKPRPRFIRVHTGKSDG